MEMRRWVFKFHWNSKWPPLINPIFLWAQKIKNLKSIIHILQSNSPRYWNVQVIFSLRCDSKWPPQNNFIIFLSAKTLKLNVRHYSNFTIPLFTIWRCASDFCKVYPEFKLAATDQVHIFLSAQKIKNLERNYSNSTITFPTIWRCAGDLLKVLLKFKKAAMAELEIFLWAQKLPKLGWDIIQILQSHFPPPGNRQVILLKFKMATTSRLFKYLWPQNSNLIDGGK